MDRKRKFLGSQQKLSHNVTNSEEDHSHNAAHGNTGYLMIIAEGHSLLWTNNHRFMHWEEIVSPQMNQPLHRAFFPDHY